MLRYQLLMNLLLVSIVAAVLPAAAQTPAERETSLARAAESVSNAVPRAQADSARPAFHFRPPAQWMNDPNGTIFHEDYFHVFYQHNPYGDRWGHMHWGHTRSKDLVHWEHLPIALWPSLGQGEEHVFSGCAWPDAQNRVHLFYTSVGPDRPNQQWSALPRQSDLLEWDKHLANPIITTKQPDGITFKNGMRDPFIFDAAGRTLMVVGADSEDEAVIPIYEAKDDTLAEWEYRGIMWRAPKSVMKFPECPNFFRVGDRWLLLTSPYRAVEYRVGRFDLDTLQFTPDGEGRIDATDRFYATNIAYDDQQRCVLFGWIRGFPEDRDWNGCLALPCELTIDTDGHPRQRPVAELARLRGDHYGNTNVELKPDKPMSRAWPQKKCSHKFSLCKFPPRPPRFPFPPKWHKNNN
jgi:beta-fructofuranosidase